MSEDNIHDGNLQQMYSDSTDEYYTPEWVVDVASKVVDGFDLDVCTSEEFSPIADDSYTSNGLKEEWYGSVWLNPPYSEIYPWLEKADRLVVDNDVENVVALVPYRTQTQWFQRNVDSVSAICFVEGCISFGDSDDTAPFGNILLLYGEVPSNQMEKLSELGKTFAEDHWRIDDKKHE